MGLLVVFVMLSLASGPANAGEPEHRHVDGTKVKVKAEAVKALGRCVPGQPAKLVSRCATGAISNQADYGTNWSASEVGKPQILASVAKEITVTDIDAAHGKVQIGFDTGTMSDNLWVNADALDCDPKNNLTSYRLPPPDESPDQCRYETVLVKGRTIEDPMMLPEAQGAALIGKAERYGEEFQMMTDLDMAALTSQYEHLKPYDLEKRLMRMHDDLGKLKDRATDIYGPNCQLPKKGYDSNVKQLPDRDRVVTEAQRSCHILLDAFDMLENEFPVGRSTPNSINHFADLLRKFSQSKEIPTDDLSFRMMLLYGLPPNAREKVFPKLNMHRTNEELGQVDGKSAPFMILHNGYVYGGTARPDERGNFGTSGYGKGVDCSHFLFDLFSAKKNSAVPVADLQAIADYHQNGGWLEPRIKPLSECFALVDVRHGTVPQPADIVTIPGHVAVVKSYNPSLGMINTIEAAGSTTNRIAHNTRPLFDPPCIGLTKDGDNWDVRPVHAGLKILRYVGQEGNTKCPIHLPQ